MNYYIIALLLLLTSCFIYVYCIKKENQNFKEINHSYKPFEENTFVNKKYKPCITTHNIGFDKYKENESNFYYKDNTFTFKYCQITGHIINTGDTIKIDAHHLVRNKLFIKRADYQCPEYKGIPNCTDKHPDGGISVDTNICGKNETDVTLPKCNKFCDDRVSDYHDPYGPANKSYDVYYLSKMEITKSNIENHPLEMNLMHKSYNTKKIVIITIPIQLEDNDNFTHPKGLNGIIMNQSWIPDNAEGIWNKGKVITANLSYLECMFGDKFKYIKYAENIDGYIANTQKLDTIIGKTIFKKLSSHPIPADHLLHQMNTTF
jgi:hypothetical protein